ncbi:ATP-binding protein [Photobacterium profundum]|uniref:Putative anti-sigma F factor antagonist n=1 Tax=Photobacterium profundum 3TCK TaxID=314280 RepID=Q1Z571_9GAMM|nr:ATP-binding protein [Photobacterium profundum]EAS43695.1 putative anti-sigma F factor antagonist [Photobacterium profundum 3TCK]PSV64129.1 ATP-binding protein [Photobacterium profundum]
MKTVKNEFKQQYKSSLEVSRNIANDVKAYWAGIGLGPDVIDQIELCLVEMVNNAYEHAYHSEDGCPIELTSYLNDKNELVTEISDYGQSMSKDEFTKAINNEFIEPDPDDPETWATSGRGFIIVVQLTDSLEYINLGDKNTFKLYKNTNR